MKGETMQAKKGADDFRVAGDTDPAKMGGAIAHTVRERGKVRLHAIGQAAHSSTLKAVAIARGHLATTGLDAYSRVSWGAVTLDDGQERSCITITVETFAEE